MKLMPSKTLFYNVCAVPFFFLDLPRFEFSNQLGYIQFNIWLADDCSVISTSKINSTRKYV